MQETDPGATWNVERPDDYRRLVTLLFSDAPGNTERQATRDARPISGDLPLDGRGCVVPYHPVNHTDTPDVIGRGE